MKLGNILGGAGRCLIAVASIAPVFAASCTERFGANCGDLRGCTGQGGESSDAAGGEGSSSEGSGATNGAGSSSGGAGGEGTTIPCADDVATDAACWTNNAYAVFVSNVTGDDETGDGTKEAPFATINKGLSAAAGKRLFVCSGATAYTEALSLEGAEDVSLHGGFVCETWELTRTLRATIQSPTNIGIKIDRSTRVRIESFRIISSDSADAGYDASAYGAFVTESQDIAFRRVTLVAGEGAAGADGESGAAGANGATPGAAQNGKTANCKATRSQGGSWLEEVACGGTRGGEGGGGTLLDGKNGEQGVPTTRVVPADQFNGGEGAPDVDQPGEAGSVGSQGQDGPVGVVASSRGAFESQGYVVSNGVEGTNGSPGQGGGGGGAAKSDGTCPGRSGAAGGMGGCGGLAGTGGGGGGASVGLFSLNSTVLLDECELQSSAGGAGGRGGIGGAPGLGGAGGLGAPGSPETQPKGKPGGDGGPGGNGGRGGSGSGGTGGPSYALVFSGAQPDFTEDTQLVPGQGGVGGLGGQVDGSAPRAPSGAAGDSAAVFEVEERM